MRVQNSSLLPVKCKSTDYWFSAARFFTSGINNWCYCHQPFNFHLKSRFFCLLIWKKYDQKLYFLTYGKIEFPSDKNEEKEGKYQPSIKPSAEIVSGLVRECLKGAAMVNFINPLSLRTDQKKASQKQVNSSPLSEFVSGIMDKDELGCLYFDKDEIEESYIFYAIYLGQNYTSENSNPNFNIDFEDRTIYFLMPSLTNKNSSLIRLNYLHNRRSLVDSNSVTLSLKDLKRAIRLQRSCNRPDVRL